VARWVKEMQQRSADLELQKAKAIPDVTLSGGAQRFSDTKDYGYAFGLSVPLPLFDRNQGNILAAQRKLAKAREESTDAAVKASTSLSDAYKVLLSSYTEATSLKNEVLPAAEQVFNAYASGFRVGQFRSSEVLDARQTLFETKERYLEALATYHKSVAEVERLIGERLDSAIEYHTRAIATKDKTE
jgi:cobalt-zinc-cadmium efflux system outer membrane protein